MSAPNRIRGLLLAIIVALLACTSPALASRQEED
jgi:hypothetical protein